MRRPSPASRRGVPPGEMPPEPGTMEGRPIGPPAPARRRLSRRRNEPTPSPKFPLPGGTPYLPWHGSSAGRGPRADESSRRQRRRDQLRRLAVLPPADRRSGARPAVDRRPATSALADNSPVAQITLHPALTGGIGSGGRPGDEGLLVVVEPRDFGGNIVNAPGDISVALLDPALTGEQARLARWDFAAAETQGMIRTGSQPGIHLRLPWTSTPAHDRLKVFVRYTTRDGRKLQAERLIGVALNGPPPALPEAFPDTTPPGRPPARNGRP